MTCLLVKNDFWVHAKAWKEAEFHFKKMPHQSWILNRSIGKFAKISQQKSNNKINDGVMNYNHGAKCSHKQWAQSVLLLCVSFSVENFLCVEKSLLLLNFMSFSKKLKERLVLNQMRNFEFFNRSTLIKNRIPCHLT